MACPTCGETMKNLGGSPPAQRYFWCPRCGTLKRDDPLSGDIFNEAPKLVERCREFERTGFGVNIADKIREAWRRLGIAEAINTPASRS
jgi:hypothetical protein